MSARVLSLEDTAAARETLEQLLVDIEAGRLVAFALVTADGAGGLDVAWGATRRLGVHAGTVLRGAVAYLGARMDAAAAPGEPERR